MSAVLERILDASVQGGLYAAGAWTLARLFPRLPGAARSTLFWCAAASFALALCWPAPIPLPVLPRALAAATGSSGPEMDARTTLQVALAGEALAANRGPGHQGAAMDGAARALTTAKPVAVTDELAARPAEARAAGSSTAAATSIDWAAVLAALWAVGVGLQLARFALQLWQARRAVRDAEPLEDGAAPRLLNQLCAQLGVSRRPALLVSPDATSPQLVGILRPAILLPADGLDDAELRLAIAHELHHLKRRDLWLGLVPGAVRAVFFFHPLAWLAHREYLVSRELACDAGVLELHGASPRAYGRLLLRLATGHAWLGSASAAAAPTFPVLKRRLSMLKPSPSSSRRWPVLVFGLAALALVPFKLVAQPAEDADRSKSHSRAEAADRDDDAEERAEDEAERAADQAERAQERAQAEIERAQEVAQRAAERASRQAERAARSGEDAARSGERAARDAERRSRRLASKTRQSEGGDRDRPSRGRHAEPEQDDFQGDSFAIVDGERSTMSGTRGDLREARRLGAGQPAPYLWFRHDGRAFLVTDKAAVAQARGLFAAQEALGQKQAALGEKQSVLGEQQAELGAQQAKLGLEMARLATRQARMAARGDDDANSKEREETDSRMEALGDQMGKLGEQQGQLGERQGELGEQQGKLGEEQGRLGEEAHRKLQALLGKWATDGTAKAVDR